MRPHGQSRVGRQEGARDHDEDRGGHQRQPGAGDRQELRAIPPPDRQPEPAGHREEHRVRDRERAAVVRRRAGGEDREKREDRHLDEHEQPRPAVLPAVQLDVQRAVGPGDPDHAEDDRELEDAPAGDVLGEACDAWPMTAT